MFAVADAADRLSERHASTHCQDMCVCTHTHCTPLCVPVSVQNCPHVSSQSHGAVTVTVTVCDILSV